MIRINKIFLGTGNAFDITKVAYSINYKPGELHVSLANYNNGIKSARPKLYPSAPANKSNTKHLEPTLNKLNNCE